MLNSEQFLPTANLQLYFNIIFYVSLRGCMVHLSSPRPPALALPGLDVWTASPARSGGPTETGRSEETGCLIVPAIQRAVWMALSRGKEGTVRTYCLKLGWLSVHGDQTTLQWTSLANGNARIGRLGYINDNGITSIQIENLSDLVLVPACATHHPSKTAF